MVGDGHPVGVEAEVAKERVQRASRPVVNDDSPIEERPASAVWTLPQV
jgi:hypothetical protein